MPYREETTSVSDGAVLYTTIGGIVVWAFLILASLFGGMEGLGLLVVVGVLGMLVGFVLYGVATLQAKALPRWCGMSFIILVPGAIPIFSIFVGYYSSVWEGLVWLVLGYALWLIEVVVQLPSSSSPCA